MKSQTIRDRGAINGSIFAIVALVVLVLFFGGFSIWSYMNYMEQKTDVDGKITTAVAEARKDQADIDEAKFRKAENEPFRQFTGPDDYGRLTFDYPKTWNAYQATDVSRGGGVKYEAYLNPVLVPPVSDATKFALRVVIEQKTYEKTLESYEAALKKGDLKSSAWSNDSHVGTRLEGNFTKDIRGSAIVIKMRDRTLTVRTDGEVFREYFDQVIQTVKFNQ